MNNNEYANSRISKLSPVTLSPENFKEFSGGYSNTCFNHNDVRLSVAHYRKVCTISFERPVNYL